MRLTALAPCCLTTPALADGFGFMAPSTNICCNGAITCRSEHTGFGRTNASGHGFVMSRRTQRVY